MAMPQNPDDTDLAEMSAEDREAYAAGFTEEVPDAFTGPRESVLSVRFHRGELALVVEAASRAGLPVRTYVRAAAVADAGTVSTLREIRDQLSTATTSLTNLIG